jgi:hypothetical protein
MSEAVAQAMALAARALARHGLADMIEAGELDARTVLSILRVSIHPEVAAHACVLLVAAGYAEPDTWASSGLKAAAVALCSDDEAIFEGCRAFAERALEASP